MVSSTSLPLRPHSAVTTTLSPVAVDAILDSGAQRSIVSTQTHSHSFNPSISVQQSPVHNADTQSLNNISVRFADGSTVEPLDSVYLGSRHPALIVPSLAENLVSVGQIVDSGRTVTFHRQGVTIASEDYHPENDEEDVIYLARSSDGLWRISLDAIAHLDDLSTATTSSSFSPVSCCTITHRLLAASAKLEQTHPSIRNRVFYLHERMGHASATVMCIALSGDSPTWINSDVTPADIRRVFDKEACLSCVLAKRNMDSGRRRYLTRHPVRKKSVPTVISSQRHSSSPSPEQTTPHAIELLPPPTTDKYHPGQCIYVDDTPAIQPVSCNRDIGFYLFVDACTGYLLPYPYRDKSAEGFIEAVHRVIYFFHTYGFDVRILRSDNERTFISDQVSDFLSTQGIKSETSAPYHHFMNGAERYWQTLLKQASAIIESQVWLRADIWSEAVLFTAQTRNRTPNSRTGYKCPHEVITGDKTDLSRTFQFAFGEMVVYAVPHELREWKLDIRNHFGFCTCTVENSVHTYRIYDPYRHKVVVRGSVHRVNIESEQYLKYLVSRINREHNRTVPYTVVKDAVYSFLRLPPPDDSSHTDERLPDEIDLDQDRLLRYIVPITDDRGTHIQEQHEKHIALPSIATYQDDGDTAQQSYAHEEPYLPPPSVSTYAVKIRDRDTPTVRQALDSEHRPAWVESMQKELRALFNGTLRPIADSDIPSNATIMQSTMQLRVKRKPSGEIDKLKSRLCACGDKIKHLFDQHEKTSPTVSELTFSAILSAAIMYAMQVASVDTVGAYLYQSYPFALKPLVILLPLKVCVALGLDPNQKYALDKYIYGLPDAGKAYYEAYSKVLIEGDYQQSRIDPCLFYRITPHGRIYIMIHVDDTYIAYTSKSELDRLLDHLHQHFQITTDWQGTSYLGLHLDHTYREGCIKITQPKLIQSLHEQYDTVIQDMQTTRRRRRNPDMMSPVSRRTSSQLPDHDLSAALYDRTQYLHLLGSLMYLTRSRPDIKAAVSILATHNTSPTAINYQDLLDVVEYIFATETEGLVLCRDLNIKSFDQPLPLLCYVDASYLTHPDSMSHTGYCISYGNHGFFFSKSQKQKLVATSSTMAETRALFSLVKDILFLTDLLNDAGIQLAHPTLIFEDNVPTETLVTGRAQGMKKCKHFLMTIAYIREQVRNGLISLRHVDTSNNRADILSKLSFGTDFRHKSRMLLDPHSIPTSASIGEDQTV